MIGNPPRWKKPRLTYFHFALNLLTSRYRSRENGYLLNCKLMQKQFRRKIRTKLLQRLLLPNIMSAKKYGSYIFLFFMFDLSLSFQLSFFPQIFISLLNVISPLVFIFMSLSLSFDLTLFLALSFSCQLSPSLSNDNDHLLSRLFLSVLTALTHPVCQSARAMACSLIRELFALFRNKLCRCICSDLVYLRWRRRCACGVLVCVLVRVFWCVC